MNSIDFENKYYNKIVIPKLFIYKYIKKTEYLVTAALYEFDPDKSTIFAIQDLKYDIKTNPNWLTLIIPKEHFIEYINDFEIIGE